MMRSTGNFSPEWGYLAPAPSMLRTARVVLVATAIGATAGAGVVLSLVDHSAGDGDKVAVAARAIVVTSVQAAPVQAPTMSEAKMAPAAAAPVAQTPVQKSVQAATLGQTPPQAQAAPQIQTAPQVQAAAPDNAAPAQDATTASAAPASITNDAAAVPQQPAVAALSDPNVATPGASVASSDAAGDQGVVGPQQTAQQKKTKHHNSSFSRDFPPVIGPALRHLFSARAGTSYYPNRAY
jgi:type IV secretory pathway VirB10-like protein